MKTKNRTKYYLICVAMVFITGCSNPIKHNAYGTTIMTFNLMYNSSDNASSIAAIIDSNPDIVCLRELTPKFAKMFRAKLTTRYKYSVFKTRKGTWGAGIASKFPILESNVFPLRPHRIPGLEAKVKIPEGEIFVACLHLFPPFAKHLKSDGYWETKRKNEILRKNQAIYLTERYIHNTLPMLLVGDMNEAASDQALEIFKSQGFVHACENAKIKDCGATFPGPALIWPALFQIDHILGRHLKFHSVEVLDSGGSDHYPVIASFSLNME